MPGVRVSIPILVAGLGLIAASGLAHADCVSACQAATYCDSEMNASGECGRLLNDCYLNECNKTLYGAIAYGTQSGAVGWSYDFNDAPSAENEALKNCSANGNDCQVVVDFWNTCAAVAAGGGVVRYGLGDNQGQAEGGALAACQQDGGTQCTVQAWSCTGP
ncbi:DUF4189 domain-containing protein [Dongia sp.]|uniref:DUF4189 domain-containing protein n=1 Tax=Dongia sp. TaxID=1977262 RepID=UPI0037520D3E